MFFYYNLSILPLFLTLFLVFLLPACVVHEQHMFVGGHCATCQPDLLLVEDTSPIDNIHAYPALDWYTLMLEGLKSERVHDLQPYAADLLTFELGWRARRLKKNEIEYRWEVDKTVKRLEYELDQHAIRDTYQLTVPAALQDYNFDRKAFPILIGSAFELKASHGMSNLPPYITVHVTNSNKLPSLSMSEEDGRKFLHNRKNRRGIYIRYIVVIEKMLARNAFNLRAIEAHYVNRIPTRWWKGKDNKETYKAFKVVRL